MSCKLPAPTRYRSRSTRRCHSNQEKQGQKQQIQRVNLGHQRLAPNERGKAKEQRCGPAVTGRTLCVQDADNGAMRPTVIEAASAENRL